MHYEVQLDLVLTDFEIKPDQVSAILSLDPSRSWLKNDFIQNTALRRSSEITLLKYIP